METRTWSYTNAFGEEQEVMEFRIKNGDGNNQYVEVHTLLNAFAESTLNFLKVEEVIKNVPKSEVVRCKDCKWHGYLTCSNPKGIKGWVTDNDFCSYRERREDGKIH